MVRIKCLRIGLNLSVSHETTTVSGAHMFYFPIVAHCLYFEDADFTVCVLVSYGIKIFMAFLYGV